VLKRSIENTHTDHFQDLGTVDS